MTNRIILLTGISASGKTTLGEVLKDRGWKTVINFTTRKPRSDKELDDYVFLTPEQLQKKLINGDFIENITYNGNDYAISRIMPNGDTFIIVEPKGRAQIIKAYEEGLIDGELTTYFLSVDKHLQKERLEKRGDKPEDIEKRMKLDETFKPTDGCIILYGKEDGDFLADIIERYDK